MKDTILTMTKALADESRLRLLMSLDGTTLCSCQLTEIFGLAASTVSQQLEILHRAGLVTGHQEGRWHYYRWSGEEAADHVKAIQAWLRKLAAGEPTFAADKDRRAVVLQSTDGPCPEEARARVLFICTGNSCRSQMAEGLLRHHAGSRFEVHSAGLAPRPIPDLTFEVMDEIGIDIRSQHPKSIMEYLGKMHFGHLITVCSHAELKCPIFPGIGTRLYWPTRDPLRAFGTRKMRLKAFRKSRDRIADRIAAWLDGQGIPMTRTTG
jgi:arsenate reductase